jgi:hypothetical protein
MGGVLIGVAVCVGSDITVVCFGMFGRQCACVFRLSS